MQHKVSDFYDRLRNQELMVYYAKVRDSYDFGFNLHRSHHFIFYHSAGLDDRHGTAFLK